MEKKTPARQYPPVYEKMIPIVLTILAVVVVGVLLIAFGVVFGFVA